MSGEISPLADNPYVQELFSILKENDKDTAGLTALLSNVNKMEQFIKSAENQITDMKAQIGELKEIQKHPIKSSLSEATQSLEANVTTVKAQLNKISEGIIESCKKAVNGFKEIGITALDNLAGFFHIKQGLYAIQKDATAGIVRCNISLKNIQLTSST